MRQDIDFFYAIFPRSGAEPVVTILGRGADGTLWMQAAYLGLDADVLDRVRRDGKGLLFVNPEDGCTYVEAQALVENCGSLEMERKLMAVKEEVLDRLHPNNFRA